MIISDNPNHKIDAEFNPDDWLILTAFHRKGNEWTSKIIGIGEEAQTKILQMIVNKAKVASGELEE